MSPVKPCTLTVAWSWYRRRCQPATLAELAWLVNSCYVTLAFSAARRGDTVIADGARNSVPKRLSGNPARKRTDE